MAKKVNMIDKWDCDYARNQVVDALKKYPNETHFGYLMFSCEGYGDVEIITATGRATCRQCGEKIAKGVRAIKGAYDFNGMGGWTACDVQIHLADCGEVSVPVVK